VWERESRTPELGRWLVDRSCRFLNIVAAVVLLTGSLPLLAVIAIAVRLTSPGPVIFRQHRVGLDRRTSGRKVDGDRRRGDVGGRLFVIYKFRTMYVVERNDQVWAGSDDSRITPVGRLLRSFRLDEIPQLWNVLKGDMNIVGPRPEQPRIFSELRDELDRYPTRQKVLPGITGLAQVSQGYDETLDDVRRKLGFDLTYIERRSPLEDLRIMARTAPVMILRKGSK
jgi:lipopolysaccharide/colanic/teichoic acid biosynthesis glycosyltransferase